jgi:hypothetical protein
MCQSTIFTSQKNSNISRRLFDDAADQSLNSVTNHNEGLLSAEDMENLSLLSSTDANLNSDTFMNVPAHASEEPSEDDVDEFSENEQRPLEQVLRMYGRNEFIFDPENGGGRRRRNKRVSRIEVLGL